MLTLAALSASKESLEIKRMFRAFSQGSMCSNSSKESLTSPPKTPSREKSHHPLSKHVHAKDIPKVYSLPWKVQPRGSYVPNQEHGTSYSYVADLAAELPISSKEVYILADGDHMGSGVINIYEDNQNKLTGSDILVDVKMFYDNPMVLGMTEISYVHSPKNENGVRMTTSPATKPEPVNRYISINVRVPRSTASEPLSLPAFRTHLPNFTHTVGDLGGIVQFQSVTLSSSDKAVIVKSLSAKRIRLRTTNGSIEGAFTSNEHISLRTVNAPINTDVVLSNSGEGSSTLELISNNAAVSASVALASSAPEDRFPSFRLLAKSGNKPVTLKAVSSPPEAQTQVEVQTTNAPATVRLPSSFEGKFDLHSTPFKPVITVGDDIKDPSGVVRRREVTNDRMRRGLLCGSISWVWSEDGGVDAPEQTRQSSASSVSIKTSNAEAFLFL